MKTLEGIGTKKKRPKIVAYDQTELISKGEVTKQTKYYKLGDRKFAITYEMSNGFPMGFNYKKCLKQYDPANARWNNLEDINILSMTNHCSNYYDHPAAEAEMKEFFIKMEDHLVRVYS